MQSKLPYLDPRADNYFGYDQETSAWILVQTWHVNLHFTDEPPHSYYLAQFRAARKYLVEPQDEDFLDFARQSERQFSQHMAAGTYSAILDKDDTPITRLFDRWSIKDYREVVAI